VAVLVCLIWLEQSEVLFVLFQRKNESALENIIAMVADVLDQACATQKARRAKLININSPWAAKVYFLVVRKKFWKDD